MHSVKQNNVLINPTSMAIVNCKKRRTVVKIHQTCVRVLKFNLKVKLNFNHPDLAYLGFSIINSYYYLNPVQLGRWTSFFNKEGWSENVLCWPAEGHRTRDS